MSWRWMLVLALCVLSASALAQSSTQPPAQPSDNDDHCPQSAGKLYARISSVGLDPARVYHVRGASIERPSLIVTLDDGTLAFTEDVCGHVTGAFFIGDGEILLQPPDRTERASLALFTGMAILEEQFHSALLRFNDDTAEVLKPYLSPTQWTAESFKDWDGVTRQFADYDALRLLVDFSHFLPSASPPPKAEKPADMLHLHLVGAKLGVFEVFWDETNAEPLLCGQLRAQNDVGFFDIWTLFAPVSAAGREWPSSRNDISIANYRIQAVVQPPGELRASTEMDMQVQKGGQRTVLFELSRYLKVDSVEWDGRALDFIQNPAVEGSQLERRGNDYIAVVFPADLHNGEDLKLRFHYAGDVLSDAGSGLLYVGARGNWYPGFGTNLASFDMKFRYPSAWTLLATGKSTSRPDAASEKPDSVEKTSEWVSERPIPIAGFNLGKYVHAEAKAGKVLVEAYSTKGVEKAFPEAPPEIIQAAPQLPPSISRPGPASPIIVTPPPPSPAADLRAVAERTANAITTFSQWFGPYPYSSLALTQMPGELSQGFPGLILLATIAFLNPQEQTELKFEPVIRTLDNQILVHEAAHEWWGDLVLWKTYRDQWISEGLANYSSLMLLEKENPAEFHQVMEFYRNDLLGKNKDGERVRDAGPVTLGQRLTSSHFPGGYETISYERGTWLFHMLRSMLKEAGSGSAKAGSKGAEGNGEELFLRVLRKVRERYAGRAISTRELMQAFEEELPPTLWYDTHHKFDWFIDSWVDGTAIPKLETRSVHISAKTGGLNVSGVIVQKDSPENMITAVPVYGEEASGSLIFLGEVLADGPETSFHLSAPAAVHKVVLDPYQTVLTEPK